MQEWTPFIEKLQCQREEENKQNDYVVYVVMVKRTAGCTENQDSWPRVNQQHVYFFSKVEILNVQQLEQIAILPILHRVD